jgi:hypothetical protein
MDFSFPSMCIPRVYPNITRDYVAHIFMQLNLGEIERIDMIPRTNEKGEKFQRVFIHFKWWFNTQYAQRARNDLISGKEIKVVYDDPWFWKVSANRQQPQLQHQQQHYQHQPQHYQPQQRPSHQKHYQPQQQRPSHQQQPYQKHHKQYQKQQQQQHKKPQEPKQIPPSIEKPENLEPHSPMSSPPPLKNSTKNESPVPVPTPTPTPIQKEEEDNNSQNSHKSLYYDPDETNDENPYFEIKYDMTNIIPKKRRNALAKK